MVWQNLLSLEYRLKRKKAVSHGMSLSSMIFLDLFRLRLPFTASSSKSSKESTRSRSFLACELLCVMRFFTNPVPVFETVDFR